MEISFVLFYFLLWRYLLSASSVTLSVEMGRSRCPAVPNTSYYFCEEEYLAQNLFSHPNSTAQLLEISWWRRPSLQFLYTCNVSSNTGIELPIPFPTITNPSKSHNLLLPIPRRIKIQPINFLYFFFFATSSSSKFNLNLPRRRPTLTNKDTLGSITFRTIDLSLCDFHFTRTANGTATSELRVKTCLFGQLENGEIVFGMPGGFGVGFGEIYRGGGRVVFYISHLWTWKDGSCFVLGGGGRRRRESEGELGIPVVL